MDAAHRVDRALGVVLVSERGDRDEAAGAGEPPPHVAAVAAVLGDRRHRGRVERLQQDRADAADEHRRVAVHPADRAGRVEPPGSGPSVDPVAVLGPVGAGDAEEESLTQPVADGGHGGAHAVSLASGSYSSEGISRATGSPDVIRTERYSARFV